MATNPKTIHSTTTSTDARSGTTGATGKKCLWYDGFIAQLLTSLVIEFVLAQEATGTTNFTGALGGMSRLGCAKVIVAPMAIGTFESVVLQVSFQFVPSKYENCRFCTPSSRTCGAGSSAVVGSRLCVTPRTSSSPLLVFFEVGDCRYQSIFCTSPKGESGPITAEAVNISSISGWVRPVTTASLPIIPASTPGWTMAARSRFMMPTAVSTGKVSDAASVAAFRMRSAPKKTALIDDSTTAAIASARISSINVNAATSARRKALRLGEKLAEAVVIAATC